MRRVSEIVRDFQDVGAMSTLINLYAFVFMRDPQHYTLPVWLASFRTAFGDDWGGAMAGSVLFTLPVLSFFLVVQRKMVGGLTAGAVKG